MKTPLALLNKLSNTNFSGKGDIPKQWSINNLVTLSPLELVSNYFNIEIDELVKRIRVDKLELAKLLLNKLESDNTKYDVILSDKCEITPLELVLNYLSDTEEEFKELESLILGNNITTEIQEYEEDNDYVHRNDPKWIKDVLPMILTSEEVISGFNAIPKGLLAGLTNRILAGIVKDIVKQSYSKKPEIFEPGSYEKHLELVNSVDYVKELKPLLSRNKLIIKEYPTGIIFTRRFTGSLTGHMSVDALNILEQIEKRKKPDTIVRRFVEHHNEVNAVLHVFSELEKLNLIKMVNKNNPVRAKITLISGYEQKLKWLLFNDLIKQTEEEHDIYAGYIKKWDIGFSKEDFGMDLI